MSHMSPLGAVVRGAIAGTAGLLAMDYYRYRRERPPEGFVDYEKADEVASYEEAPAPGRFGQRLVEGVFRTELPDDTAGRVTNLVHWGTGAGWGVAHAIFFGAVSRLRQPLLGAATGAAAFTTAYTVLPKAGLYAPIGQYRLETVWNDLAGHLVFGLVTGTAFGLVAR